MTISKAKKLEKLQQQEAIRLANAKAVADWKAKQQELDKIRVKHPNWTKFDPADYRAAPSYLKNPVPCPQCKGHVCCITHENAYGVGVHQKHACMQCGGMGACGWVEADSRDATCIHDFSTSLNIGRCLHQYVCSKCGKKEIIDSSD